MTGTRIAIEVTEIIRKPEIVSAAPGVDDRGRRASRGLRRRGRHDHGRRGSPCPGGLVAAQSIC